MPNGKKKYKNYNKKNFEKRVRHIILKNKETKHISFEYNQTTISTAALGSSRLAHLTGITQGDGNVNRDGNQVRLSGLFAQMVFTAADTTNIIRVIVARYKGQYTSSPFPSTEVYNIIDLDDLDVVYDRAITIGTAGPASKMIKIKLKFRNKNLIQFDTTTSTSVTVNPYYIYFVSDSGAVSHPEMTGQIRVYYKDI